MMSMAENIVPEFDQEMQSTRRVLAVVPEVERDWKPHPKSYSLGDLSAHLANLPKSAGATLGKDGFDMAAPASDDASRAFTTTAALLDTYDRNVADARNDIATASDEIYFQPWTLKNGNAEIFTLPKIAVLRAFVLSHMVHHRGQLTVYLRMRDVPLPEIYGPTADSTG